MTTPADEALRACEGFEVVSADGRVGYVERLLFLEPVDPTVLVVRVGLFARHTLLVPAGDVAAVDRARHRLALARPPAAGNGVAVRAGNGERGRPGIACGDRSRAHEGASAPF